jgi:Uma2 family endonuclease
LQQKVDDFPENLSRNRRTNGAHPEAGDCSPGVTEGVLRLFTCSSLTVGAVYDRAFVAFEWVKPRGHRPRLQVGRKVTRNGPRSIVMIVPVETVARKLFTVDQYHRMSDIGLFPADKRFELIRGEIFEMPSAMAPHSGRVNRLNHLFMNRLGDSVITSVQNPSILDDYSEPVPDVSLLKPRADFYSEQHPTPEDVLLLVEISYTTLRFDTKIKTPLYAEAGIQEYWILNLPQNVLEIRGEPLNGRYMRQEIIKPGETVSPRAFPGVSFQVEELLG